MNKLNVIIAVAALSLFINHAEAMDNGDGQNHPTIAVKFNEENLLDEKNRNTALKLYRGAYQVLQTARRELSEAGNEAIKEADKKFTSSIAEFSPITPWPNKINIVSLQNGPEVTAHIVYEHKTQKLSLDNAIFPAFEKASYRKIENLKKTAQDLYNAYDPLYHVYGKRGATVIPTCDISEEVRKEAAFAISENISLLCTLLGDFSQEIIQKIIDESNHEAFKELEEK